MKFLALVLTFVLLFGAISIADAQQSTPQNTPEQCGVDIAVNECQKVTFISVNSEGDMIVSVTQRVTNPQLAAFMTTNDGITAFFNGFGHDNVEGLSEATHLIQMDYLNVGDEYRAFVGVSGITGAMEPTLFVFVRTGATAYVFAFLGEPLSSDPQSAGQFVHAQEYMKQVITGNDWTVTPEGYINAFEE